MYPRGARWQARVAGRDPEDCLVVQSACGAVAPHLREGVARGRSIQHLPGRSMSTSAATEYRWELGLHTNSLEIRRPVHM